MELDSHLPTLSLTFAHRRQALIMFDTSYLLISLVFSSIGLGYFIYGKKQKHTIAYYSGLCLIVYPYLVSDPTLMFITGIALMFAPKFIRF